mgnify:CR=1 FL=1
MEHTEEYVKLENVSKIYGSKEVKIIAVDEISFRIKKGEFVVVVGPSGAGKTTVLNILGGMDKATSGNVWIDGKNIAKYTDRQLTGYRREDIGFVFQFYNLIPDLTVQENIQVVADIAKQPMDIEEVMKALDIDKYKNRFPKELSGGQQQRLCIARALAVQPDILLMDEPTSALDPVSTLVVEQLACELKETCTLVVVTHNMQQAARISDSVAFFLLGELVEHAPTAQLFKNPTDPRTADYLTGRFG